MSTQQYSSSELKRQIAQNEDKIREATEQHLLQNTELREQVDDAAALREELDTAVTDSLRELYEDEGTLTDVADRLNGALETNDAAGGKAAAAAGAGVPLSMTSETGVSVVSIIEEALITILDWTLNATANLLGVTEMEVIIGTVLAAAVAVVIFARNPVRVSEIRAKIDDMVDSFQ